MARLPFQEANTAPIAPQSCSIGSSGKSFLSTFLTVALNALHSFLSSSAGMCVSSDTPNLCFTSSIIPSKILRMPSPSLGSMPAAFSITTSEYIIIRRRYASYTKRGSPVLAIIPGMVFSVKPMFKMVSIIPGIEARAPERTDTKSGFFSEPNCFLVSRSIFLRLVSTSAFKVLGYVRLLFQ